MAQVNFDGDSLTIEMSLPEIVFSFHGSFRIPLNHVTNAYVSPMRDLELQWRLLGTGAGRLMTGGIFTTPEGIIFCDLHGQNDCLVIETHGERFRRLAFTLDPPQDPNVIAHEISAKI